MLIVAAVACAPGSGPAAAPDASAAPPTAVPSPAPDRVGDVAAPFLRVLGVAQDGGLPHAACEHGFCRRARRDPRLASPVASLGLVIPGTERPGIYLVDATPDVRVQLDALVDVRQPPQDRVDRAPVDGVLLTHAHMGHYLGLAFFGFEAIHTQGLPVFSTPKMAAFLRRNEPWGQLVRIGNLELRERAPGQTFRLGAGAGAGGVGVEVIAVPHRDELSDTVGFLFAGPTRRVLYVPDTDGWQHWQPTLPEVLAASAVDVALLDGTFYSMDELPGRDIATVRHPLIFQTMDLLGDWVAAGGEAVFIHLNHSNPALDPASDARATVEARGFRVAAFGEEIAL